MSDAEVLSFIESFVHGHDSDAPINMAALYVNRPSYMQHGKVDRDYPKTSSNIAKSGLFVTIILLQLQNHATQESGHFDSFLPNSIPG
jgi:hypothetical protein